jgi:hypothetical protein
VRGCMPNATSARAVLLSVYADTLASSSSNCSIIAVVAMAVAIEAATATPAAAAAAAAPQQWLRSNSRDLAPLQ